MVTIIAEAGVNHNGSLEIAMQLVDVAIFAGADIIKFQTFKANQLTTQSVDKANYQKDMADVQQSQYEMLKQYELDLVAHKKIQHYCKQNKIEYLSSPFDVTSLCELTNELNLHTIKIPSGEITNCLLLLKAAQAKKKVILSTGMSSLADIERALAVLSHGYVNMDEPIAIEDCYDVYYSHEGQASLLDKVTLLHCTSEYPASYADVNLKALDTLKIAFGLPVGFSDHTQGISIPIAAVARGAVMIEKHFTLDKALPGPDHKASLDPDELAKMVKSIRQVEQAIGSGIKLASANELKNKPLVRKSLVANIDIKKGELFSKENLGLKRAGIGISAIQYWQYLGRRAIRDYVKDEIIDEKW